MNFLPNMIFCNYIYFWLVGIMLCIAKPIPPDAELFPDSDFNLPNEVILFVLSTILMVFVVAIIVATLSQSSLSDSEFEDVAAEEQITIPESSSRVSKHGKLVRGRDVNWKEVEVFDTAKDFFDSNRFKQLKSEFTVSRKRQFDYAQVSEYRCKFARKVGYNPCPRKIRICFMSHCQEVKVESTHDDNLEHLHEEDNHANMNKSSCNYRWSPRMTEFIEQCVKNHGKPKVALRYVFSLHMVELSPNVC